MNLTIFGIIWLTISFFGLILNNSKILFSLALFGLCLQSTNVLYLGENGVGPGLVSCGFLIIFALFNIKSRSRSKTDNKFFATTILCIFSLVVFAIIFSFLLNDLWTTEYLLPFFQLIIYIVTFFICFNLKGLDFGFLKKLIKFLTIFLLVMGVVQLLITTNFLPRINLIKDIFYNDNAENVYFNANNYYRICSTFMEPSYYATFLVPIYSFYFINYKKISDLPLIFFIVLEIILTLSTTAYLAFLIANIFLFFSRVNDKLAKIICLCAIFGLLFLFIFCRPLLDEVIFNKLESGSANTRYWRDYECIQAFISSPILGVGYKAVRGSSLITSILGQLGIVGALLIFSIFIIFFYLFIKNKKRNLLISNFSFCVVAVFLCLFIACPDLDMCTLWLFLMLFAVSVKNYNAKKLIIYRNKIILKAKKVNL